MVKRKTVRQKISKKESKKAQVMDEEANSTHHEEDLAAMVGSNASHRVKRKLAKKLQFLSKLQETQSILGAKKVISKKRNRKKSALNNLSTLGEFLPSSNELPRPTKPHTLPKNKRSKARQQLLVSESQQLVKVLDHPEFKSNPFSAIHEHLKNTLSPLLMDSKNPVNKERSNKRSPKQKRKLKEMQQSMEF